MPGVERGARLQVPPRCRAWPATASTRRTRSPCARRCRRAPARSCGTSTTAGGTPTWMQARAERQKRLGPDVDLRGAPGVLAPRPGGEQPAADLPRGGRRARALRAGKCTSRTSSCCRSRSTRSRAPGATRRPASSRRPRASARRRTSCTSSTRFTRPASASSSTGFRRTFPPTSTAWSTSTARTSTSTPTGARAITRTGAAASSTTTATRCAASCSPPASTGWTGTTLDGLRVDAVASMLHLDYLAQAGRVDPQQVRRPGEPRRDHAAAAVQRGGRREPSRRRHDRGGVDRVADGLAADLRRRPRLPHEVGPRLDERHARLHEAGSRSSASSTTPT